MEDLTFGTFVNAMDLTAQKAVGELVEMSCQQEAEAGHPAGLGMFLSAPGATLGATWTRRR